MAVLGRLLVGSGERLDLADLLSLDSYVSADFKYLMQSFIGAKKPYVLHGLDVINPQDSMGTDGVQIRVADSVVYYPGSKAGSFFYGLSSTHPNFQPLIPELRKNATNFVYLTFTTQDMAKDTRAFWDPDQNGGAGGEFSQDVNTETALKIDVGVSVTAFPENTIPVAKIVLNLTGITSIQDCRDHLFRLGTGGVSPDPFASYSFKNTPSSTYARLEPPTKMTTYFDPNPFQGGDKNISTLKEWMDVVMTRLKEVGGTTYWYQGNSIAGPNINNVFMDSLGSTIKSKGSWEHDASIAGKATWTEDIHYYSLVDARDLIIRADTITLPSTDKVAWINIQREASFNILNTPVDWINGSIWVNGAVGTFANLSVGDWIKKTSDSSDKFLRVEKFHTLSNGSGSGTVASSAQSITLSAAYTGVTGTDVGHFTQGEFVVSDINITDRTDPSVSAAGGNFFWLAYRTDTILGLSSAVKTDLSVDIIEADGIRARVVVTSHGLIDGDRVYIASGLYTGTWIVEVEDVDNFYITTSIVGDEYAVPAHYAIVTTAATDSGTPGFYSLESSAHGCKPGEKIAINGVGAPWDGSYTVNVRNATSLQIPVSPSHVNQGAVPAATVSLPRLNVRTEFGTVKVVQGETASIGDLDSQNLMSFIGMGSLAQTKPNYFVPNGYNTINGHQDYNSDPTDSLTTRVSRLTAMMADRVQDRGMQIIGRTNIINRTNGADQEVSALANLVLKKPGSFDITINMTSVISMPVNSVAVLDIDRDGTGTLVPQVLEWDANYVLAENQLMLFYRFTDTKVHTWDGHVIAASGHLNTQAPEDSQNRNIAVFNPGRVKLTANTGLVEIIIPELAEASDVTVKAGSLITPGSYFTFNSEYNNQKWYVWYKVDAVGVDPAPPGRSGILVSTLSSSPASTVAAQTAVAISGLAGPNILGNAVGSVVKVLNQVTGPADDTQDGTTGFTFETRVQGLDPDIQLIIPGAANNTIDVDAINTSGLLILADNKSAWVRVNRFAAKTFNTVSSVDVPDTNSTGFIYITSTSSVPIDQDVFVLWSRFENNLLETNHSHKPEGNIYDETLLLVTAAPGLNEILGPISSGSEILLPNDSRDAGNTQEYIVGSGQLEIYLNGQFLVRGVDWSEVGVSDSLANRIQINIDLVVGDYLTFRIDAQGAVYFANNTSLSTTLQQAYDASRFINVAAGQPIVVTGVSGKLMSIQGDLEVTGVVDLTGIQYTPVAVSPLLAAQAGTWVSNTKNSLVYQDGNGLVNVIDNSDNMRGVRAVRLNLENLTGSTLVKLTPVSVDSNSYFVPVNVSNKANVMAMVGLVDADILNANRGDTVISGSVQDIASSPFAIGDVLYVSKAGALTNIEPVPGVGGFVSGDWVIRVGIVVRSKINPLDRNIVVGIRVIKKLDNVYDKATTLVAPLTALVPISLPLAETYSGSELDVYLNGQYLEPVEDYNYVGSYPRTQITFNSNLVIGDRIRFRKDREI